ncbi:MAG: DUF881 domain-containing protein [Actinomycetota bacterium]|nr:DUF881 domain-containing protein [Actinomycetota bacterium]
MRIRASLAAVLAVVGFLTLVAARGVEDARRGTESRRAGLVRLIRERQGEVDELGQTLVALRAEVLSARRRLSDRAASDARRVRDVQLQAGTVPMSGPGLQVTLSDSDREGDDPADRAALAVHDVDLQLVVNALWAVGAEAVAVNGQRLVATSPIRAAGETITVNFRPLVPPYEIFAIGAGKDDFEDTDVGERYRRFADELGFGFDVKARRTLSVPAFLGTLQLSAAQAGSGPAPGAPGATKPGGSDR